MKRSRGRSSLTDKLSRTIDVALDMSVKTSRLGGTVGFA